MITFEVATKFTTEMVDITAEVQTRVKDAKIEDGVCTVFIPHTTAAIMLNENADPSVRRDILVEMNKLVPQRDYFTHTEGNSAAHIKAGIVGSSVSIIIEQGKLMLGKWQGIYFCEFDGPREREVWIKFVGSK